MSSAISDDPLFSFKLKVDKEALLRVVFVDNQGKKWENYLSYFYLLFIAYYLLFIIYNLLFIIYNYSYVIYQIKYSSTIWHSIINFIVHGTSSIDSVRNNSI